MYDGTRVEILEGFCHLVYDEADVNVFEDAFGDYVVEVCFHVLEEQINVFVIIGPDGVVEPDDVGVFELL